MFESFWKGKTYKSPNGIQSHDLQVRSQRSNPLRNAVRIILHFIVYFDGKYYVTIWRFIALTL